MSAKRLQRYVNEFAGKHNVRDEDTLAQMVVVAARAGREASDVSGADRFERAAFRRAYQLAFFGRINARAKSPGVASP